MSLFSENQLKLLFNLAWMQFGLMLQFLNDQEHNPKDCQLRVTSIWTTRQSQYGGCKNCAGLLRKAKTVFLLF